MKVKLFGRKVYLPKSLIEKAGLPESGTCEALVVGDEVRIRPELPKALNMSRILRNRPPVVAIREMAGAEEVADV